MSGKVYWVLSFMGILWLLAGYWLTPYSPYEQSFRGVALSGSSWNHWFGVDGLGRDVGSRLWRGAGNSTMLALASSILSFGLAGLLVFLERIFSGSIGGVIRFIMGLSVALPVVFLGLLILVFLKPSPFALVMAVAIGLVPLIFRQIRILWLGQAGAVYVQASKILGAGPWDRFRYTILPNLLPDLGALFRMGFALSLLELSGLAFLGLLGDPDMAELGAMLKQNQAYLFQAPFLLLWPGIILSAILSWVLLGNRLSR